MKKCFFDISELVGNTPLVCLKKIEKEMQLSSKIYAKLEMQSIGGSVKDRVAEFMIREAEKGGLLAEGGMIIEATSGNTGIALAMLGAKRGYRVTIVMPENMSGERVALMSSLGAEVLLTPASFGMAGAVKSAEELGKAQLNCYIPRQFENPLNPLAHKMTTGPEIYSALDGKVDIFVAGVGTGGTISGVGEYLKEKNQSIKVVGIEPYESAVLSGFAPHVHGILGIGAGFVPKTLNKNVIDEFITVTTEEAYRFTKLLWRKEGILAGVSSGAALCAAVKLAKRRENVEKSIVTILPDRAERYFSTELFV